MTRTRRIGWIITLIALAAFVVSTVAMGRRAAAFNREADYSRFRIDLTKERAVTVFGRELTLRDAFDDQGGGALAVRYGDAEFLAPVKAPPVRDVPELGVYAEWAVLLMIREVHRSGELRTGPDGAPLPPRYVLITRHTAEGFEPEGWGTVRRADWTFNFYEFRPDGTVAHEQFRFPRAERGERSLARRTSREDAKPHELELVRIPPLRERTWQYDAALHVIPKLQVPSYRFRNDAFSFETMGWTLPAAGFSALGLLVGLGLACMPRRRTERPSTTDA